MAFIQSTPLHSSHTSSVVRKREREEQRRKEAVNAIDSSRQLFSNWYMGMEVGKAARKIMVALHDNEESLYALEWALNHLIKPVIGCNSSKFVLIYAAPEAMASTPLTGKEIAFSSHVVGVLKRNQKRMAEKVMEQATKLCEKHGVAYESKMFVGEPKIVTCEMSKKLRVDLLVVESHQGGWFKRFFSANNIGRYCVDHAKCPVMVVKRTQQYF